MTAPGGARAIALPFAICTAIWGSTWFVIVGQLRYVTPWWAVCYRFSLAAVAMAVLARLTNVPLALGRAGQRLAVVIGICQFMLNYLFVYAAEERIASGLVALVSALLIVPNAVMGRIFLRQPVSRGFLAGSGVAIAGIAVLFVDEVRRGGVDPWRTAAGVALSLGGVLAASSANVMQGTSTARAVPTVSLMAWAMAYGAVLDGAFALAMSGRPSFPLATTFLAGLLYLSIAGSALTFTLYANLIRRIGPAQAGYIGVLIPVIAMALSTLFEGYRWTPAAAAGAALAIAGLAVAMRARSPAAKSG